MSHACELETSVYRHLNDSAVQMDKADKEIDFHASKYTWHDLVAGPPVRLVEWWSRISKSGTIGDPTLATREKGALWFEATIAALVEFIREFRAFPIRPKVDLH
jgi:creatinine amidohydrolase